jgi:hypothetical protein
MLLKPLTLAAAGLAAATQAFLLPPDLSQSDVDAVNAVPDVKAFAVPQHVSFNLSCPGCLQYHGAKAASDKPSHLELSFEIGHPLARDTLLVNGFQLFPDQHSLFTGLKAPLVSDDAADLERLYKKLRGHRPDRRHRAEQLGYELSARIPQTDNADGLEIIELDFQILQVGNAFVEGIPNIHITLISDTTSGALVIGSIEKAESKTSVATPMDKQEECTTFMCKWMAIMKDQMSKMNGKPCGGKGDGGQKASRPHHNHHHGARPYKGEGDARHHSWGQLFKNIAAHILLPIAVGIVAGVSVSLIGMMVGTLIVSVWRAFVRRPGHRRTRSRGHSHSHHKAPKQEVAAAEVEEKSGLLENQDPPPSYEEEVAPKADV